MEIKALKQDETKFFAPLTLEHERRFQAEDDGLIVPDKSFRWSMLDEELNYRLF